MISGWCLEWRRATRLDDVEGLDDAGGAHAGEAAVHEGLHRLPRGVIGERHGAVLLGVGVGSVAGGRCEVRADVLGSAAAPRGTAWTATRAAGGVSPRGEDLAETRIAHVRTGTLNAVIDDGRRHRQDPVGQNETCARLTPFDDTTLDFACLEILFHPNDESGEISVRARRWKKKN